MPIYEYVCKKCAARFEHLAKSMSDSANVKCQRCGSTRTEREMSVFAVGSSTGGNAPVGPCADCGEAGGCRMRDA